MVCAFAASSSRISSGGISVSHSINVGLGPKRAIEVREPLFALPGELDDRAATVGPVAAAPDQAGVLEAVKDRNEIGRVDAEQLDERLLW